MPIETATGTAVLNADDEHCLRMADYTEAEHLCYVTMNPGHQLVKEHIRAAGRAVVLEEGFNGHMITIYDHGNHIPLLWTHLIPATLEGRALHNVQNAMFSAALAYSLDISLENIRHGLRTFDTTFFQAPGRMNLYDEHPFKVILDYGHNPAAVKAMCELVDRFDVDGKKIVVLSAPGDRRDQDIGEIGMIAAGHFDHYILRTDDNARGRDRDDVPGMLRKMLLKSGVAKKTIEIVHDEKTAVDSALTMAQPGDLVFIFGDNIKRCWKQIIYFDSGEKSEYDEKPVQIHLSATALSDFSMEDVEIIRDERGVRIAREPEESD